MKISTTAAAAISLLVGSITVSQAAERVTWVASNGSDASATCSHTAPCRTLASAYGKTTEGGTINVMDLADYGGLDIKKSISIAGDGGNAGLVAPMSGGTITIDAAADDVVSITGLSFNGRGTSGHGIGIGGAASVYIGDVAVHGYTAPGWAGISLATATDTRLYIDHAKIYNNHIGIYVGAAFGANEAFLNSTVVAANDMNSLWVNGAAATAKLANSQLTVSPVKLTNDGKLVSYGDNVIVGATPTKVRPLQ